MLFINYFLQRKVTYTIYVLENITIVCLPTTICLVIFTLDLHNKRLKPVSVSLCICQSVSLCVCESAIFVEPTPLKLLDRFSSL